MKTITLTPEQLQALADNGPAPVEALDAAGNAAFVLLRREEYERLQEVQDEAELDHRQVSMLVNEAMKEDDENDPLLESYQQYRTEGR